MTDVLATSEDGRYRVRLVLDEHAENPRHDETGVHVITIDTHFGRYLPVDKDGGPLAEAWERLKWNRWNGVETFTRYVSIMHGGVVLESAPQYGARSFWYVTGQQVQDLELGNLAESYVEAEKEAYEAWAEGDTWGFIVEERISWSRDDDPDESMTTWQPVDSCFGYYGHPYARSQAREALAFYAARPALVAA